MVTGMLVDESSSLDFDCDACIQAKHAKLPFPKSSPSQNLEIGDLIVADIWGPASVESIHHHTYYLSFTDFASRLSILYFLKQRSDSLNALRLYHKFFITQKGRSFRILKVDNAKEFILGDFKSYLDEHGIILETTAPYSSSQNGVAERLNRTLVERARAMIIDSNSPKFLWEDAVAYACYLKNRSPTRALSNITPHEAFWGKIPDISNVHPFGTKCWVLVPEARRSKLDPKSEQYQFTGIADHSAGFRYYVPHSRKILHSRNVIFTSSPQPPIDFPIPPSTSDASGLEGEPSTSSLPKTEPSYTTVQDQLPNRVILRPEKETQDPPAPRRSSRNTIRHDYRAINNGTEALAKQVVSSDAPIAQLLPPRDSRSSLPSSSSTSFTSLISDFAFISHDGLTDMPISLKEVQSRPDWPQWKEAMEREISQLLKLGTFTLEHLPLNRKPIGCRWVFVIKRDPSGNITKYKARLVAQGFSQIPGQDFLATYAPVMRLESYRTLLALAAAQDWEIHQIDVVGAYLNGELEEEIYMRQPPGYEDGTPRVCRLHKALYGLKQAGRVWNIKFNDIFVNTLGYTRIPADFCVYIRRNQHGLSIVIIHVDDSSITTFPPSYMTSAKAEIANHLEITDLGEAKTFVGLQIQRDRANHTISIHQTSYITRVLERFGMLSSHIVHSPMDPNVSLTPTPPDSHTPPPDFPYAAAIGSLMYAAVATRPDISHAVQCLSQFTSNPSQQHVTAVKRVFRYLNGTRNLGITYGTTSDTTLYGYTDADWGQDSADRKSISGYVFLISGGAVSWSSKKQTSVALSTMEAEYMALCHTSKDAIWLRTLLSDLTFPQAEPTTIFCDNQAAIIYAHDNQFHARAKHIGMQYHFVRDQITQKILKVTYVPTKDNCADIFTKGLARPSHSHLVTSIGMSAC